MISRTTELLQERKLFLKQSILMKKNKIMISKEHKFAFTKITNI